jgi:hypothetical protein
MVKGNQKFRHINKLRKMVGLAIIFLIIGLAAAGLWTHFAKVKPEFNVKQSITLDNHSYNVPIIFTEDVIAGNVYRSDHIVNVLCDSQVNISVAIKSVNGLTISFECDGVPVTFPQYNISKGAYNLTIVWSFDIHMTESKYKPEITFILI